MGDGNCTFCTGTVGGRSGIRCHRCPRWSHWHCLGLPGLGSYTDAPPHNFLRFIQDSGAQFPCSICRAPSGQRYEAEHLDDWCVVQEQCVIPLQMGSVAGAGPVDEASQTEEVLRTESGVQSQAVLRTESGVQTEEGLRTEGGFEMKEPAQCASAVDMEGRGPEPPATTRRSPRSSGVGRFLSTRLSTPPMRPFPSAKLVARPSEHLLDPSLSSESFDLGNGKLVELVKRRGSTVLRGTFKEGQLRGRTTAIKILDVEHHLEEQFLREVDAGALRHGNLCSVLCAFRTEDQFFICTEFCRKGNLFHLLMSRGGSVPLVLATRLVAELAAGLHYLHCRKIVHRDVQPENGLLTWELKAQLGDFGSAAVSCSRITSVSVGHHFTRIVGTKSFQSPEILAGTGTDHRADIWSLGVTYYTLLFGDVPYASKGDANVAHAIAKLGLPSTAKAELPPPYLKALNLMVKEEKNLRLEVPQLLAMEETQKALETKRVKAVVVADVSELGMHRLEQMRVKLVKMGKNRQRSEAFHKQFEVLKTELGGSETVCSLVTWDLRRGFYPDKALDEALSRLTPWELSKVFHGHVETDPNLFCKCYGGKDKCYNIWSLVICIPN